MKKAKLMPSVLLLILLVGVFAVGIYAASPANNIISGTIKVNAAGAEIEVSAYFGTTEVIAPTETRTGITREIDASKNVLEFVVAGKNDVSNVDDVTLTIRVKNKSKSKDLGVYFYGGSAVTPPEKVAYSDIKKTGTLKGTLETSGTEVDFVDEEYLWYQHIMPDDENEETTNNIVDMTVTFSLKELFEENVSGKFDVTLNVEDYNPDHTTNDAYSGSAELVRLSSTLDGTQNLSTIESGATKRTTVAENAFLNNGTVKNIIIPSTVTTIGANAFKGCTALESITMPSSITEIGADAFDGCTSLTKVNVADYESFSEIDFKDDEANPLNVATDLIINGKKEQVSGAGTVADPYKIATFRQFEKMLERVYEVKSTTYYNAEGDVAQEASATTKVEINESVKMTYTKSDGAWGSPSIKKVKTIYCDLEGDLDFAGAEALGAISININGNEKTLKNVNGANFEANGGSIFDTLIDSNINNLTIENVGKLASIASVARGNVVLENIVTTSQEPVILDGGTNDRNQGAFVNYVLGTTHVIFKNCVNNADINSNASYGGVFVGGYAKTPAKVTFNACINNGDVTSEGLVGVFFGNNATNINEEDLVVLNCQNNGVITGIKGSHILCPETGGIGFNATKCASLDATVAGVITTDPSKLVEPVQPYTVAAGTTAETAHNIYVTVAGNETINTSKYTYQIILARNVSYRSGGSFRISITFDYNEANGDSISGNIITFNDIFYEMYARSSIESYKTPVVAKDVTSQVTGGELGKDYTRVFLDKTLNTYFNTSLHTHGYTGLYFIDDLEATNVKGLHCAGTSKNANAIMYCTLNVIDKTTGETHKTVSVNLNSYQMESYKLA